MPLTLPREQTYRQVSHPENLKGRVRKGEQCMRVDHESVRTIQTLLDDPRYIVYANTDPRINTWMLWRLEHDGVYRHSHSWPGELWPLGPDFANAVVAWVRAHDTRGGFDLAGHMEAEERALERDQERTRSDFTQDFADTYLYPALRKDGAHRYVVGL